MAGIVDFKLRSIKVKIGQLTIICGQTVTRAPDHITGFDQYRGIYLKRIPTYSFPLMLDVMQRLGVEEDRVLRNTGLTRAEASRDGVLVSFIQALKLMRNILATTPRPDIGLHIGSQYQINTYGVLGYAMMSSPTWGDALKLARQYYSVASSLVHLGMELDEKNDNLTYIAKPFYPDMVDIEPFTVEKLFASLIAVSKPLLPKAAAPISVSFAYPAPSYAKRYGEIFDCPVEFDAPANRFCLNASVLKQPLSQANAVSAEIGRKMCDEILTSQERDGHDLTRQVIEFILAVPGSMPTMEEVAKRLNMSSRTLRRNLQAEDTTFQDIVDLLRQDLSKHYLKRSRLSLDAIASLVGFTETTNFRRAFKRWEGIPPAQYRRQFTQGTDSP